MTRFAAFTAMALAGAALLSTPAFAASDVVGKWNLVADVQGQQMKSTMTVAEAGGAYTVDITDVPPEAPPGGGDGAPAFGPMKSTISDVAVDGSVLTFKRHLASDQFNIDLTYKATVTGNTLTATAGSEYGDTPVTGTRAQ